MKEISDIKQDMKDVKDMMTKFIESAEIKYVSKDEFNQLKGEISDKAKVVEEKRIARLWANSNIIAGKVQARSGIRAAIIWWIVVLIVFALWYFCK